MTLEKFKLPKKEMKENGVDMAKYILPLLKQIFISVEKIDEEPTLRLIISRKLYIRMKAGILKCIHI